MQIYVHYTKWLKVNLFVLINLRYLLRMFHYLEKFAYNSYAGTQEACK